ncbi:TonB-dependent receptor [Chryseobacterium taklimakanense]|uniref:TonB-dependent receptor n=1 Tax=Chryseobacterium taklimakanense TaxID=536441 RepID=A0A3G8WKX4_9FLAO|nr:TonB-dependent receptor [Chryseobacterium taklimakanense]AZI21249.1 TonB-dependent receptor [Chryseobacterium taklimakanense]
MIKKLSLISLFTLLPASFYYAQTTVYAYVKDAQGNPVERADVDLVQSSDDVTADKIGYFQFVNLQPGQYQIIVSKAGLESKTVDFAVAEGEKRKDLGVISLIPAATTSDLGVIVIDDAAADDDGSSMQPTVGLLSSGRDAFQNVAAFELGAYWFRPRGVDNRYEDVLFNGVSMSKNDDGRIDFSNWGGLNDVTRYPQENVDNITPSENAFGNLGGLVYYNTRASNYRKGTSLAYSFTNRSYRHRAMATYSTGMLPSGWAFTFSGSRRWAEEGVIDGTYQDSYAYFGSIEKKFSDRFSMNLTAFGAPTYRASNSPNTQEAYDIMGKNYNSYWGWQDGEKRNSRIRKTFEPIFMLQTYNKIGKTSNWNNTFSYQQGSDARSRLDWFHGADPNPTYYRKLPSFGNYTEDEFVTNSQIDWLGLYQQNYGVAAAKNYMGISYGKDAAGNDIEGRRAIYTLVDDVNEDKTYNFVSHFDTKLSDTWKLNLNFKYQKLNSDNFRRIKDLLGADFALNLDAFGADNRFNMDSEDVKVYEGQRTQYSYELFRDSYVFNASTEIDFPKWNLMASAFGGYSESQRNGHYRNHFYQDNSKGESAVYDAFDAGLKARVTYKINGKNFIVYNGTLFSLAPTLNEIFINPRVSDYVTPGVDNQIINSNELSYIVRGQVLKLRLSGYWTDISNATEISRYFAELDDSGQGDRFTTEVLAGTEKRYKGIELGADIKLSPTFNIIAVGSYGDYTYQNNPDVYISTDDEKYARGAEYYGKANIKGYKIAGTPQKAASLGFRYNSPKFWWFGASANYLADQYLDFSVLNRTPNFYTNPLTGDNYLPITDSQTKIEIPGATEENVAALLKQTKFEDQFMINANAGKTFQFGKYRVGASISVNNILNNRDYVTGGFEQGRKSNFREAYLESQRETPLFGPKLWYDRGTTFFANVYFRF